VFNYNSNSALLRFLLFSAVKKLKGLTAEEQRRRGFAERLMKTQRISFSPLLRGKKLKIKTWKSLYSFIVTTLIVVGVMDLVQ
jgi:hypothetical protein